VNDSTIEAVEIKIANIINAGTIITNGQQAILVGVVSNTGTIDAQQGLKIDNKLSNNGSII
jgi:hypothetical protein